MSEFWVFVPPSPLSPYDSEAIVFRIQARPAFLVTSVIILPETWAFWVLTHSHMIHSNQTHQNKQRATTIFFLEHIHSTISFILKNNS